MFLVYIASVLALAFLSVQARTTSEDSYIFVKEFGAFYKQYTPKVWHEAVETCAKEGAVVWTPPSRVESVTIINEVFKLQWPIWVDLSEVEENGNWKSIKGETLSKAYDDPWKYFEPDNGKSHSCGKIYKDSNILHTNCDWVYPFICKRRPEDVKAHTGTNKNIHMQPNSDNSVVPHDRAFGKKHITEFVKIYSRKLAMGANEEIPKRLWNWSGVDGEELEEKANSSEEKNNHNADNKEEQFLEMITKRQQQFSEQMSLLIKHKLIEAKESMIEENRNMEDNLKKLVQNTKVELQNDIHNFFLREGKPEVERQLIKTKIMSNENMAKEQMVENIFSEHNNADIRENEKVFDNNEPNRYSI